MNKAADLTAASPCASATQGTNEAVTTKSVIEMNQSLCRTLKVVLVQILFLLRGNEEGKLESTPSVGGK